MRISSSLYIRKLLNSFHPPLPPQTPRESKQLLNILESAFQQRLDETHPAPKTAAASTDSQNGVDSVPDPAHRATHSTHAHLDTILGHPLFQKQSTTFLQRHGLADTAVKTFDDALRNRGVDLNLVQACALQYLQGVSKRGKCSDDRKLGPRLARWFYSTWPAGKKTVLLNQEFMDPLVSVMFADGREGDVWQWLQVLYERSFANTVMAQVQQSASDALLYDRAEDRLVSLMIRETARRRRLQEAMQLYIQAYEYRRDRQAAAAPTIAQSGDLQRSWRHIAGAILSSPTRKTFDMPSELFTKLVNYGVSIEHNPFDPVFLQTYHPSSPSAQPLARKLKTSFFTDSLLKWQSKPGNKVSRRILLVAILDAAELSLRQNRPQQAQDLLQFAEKAYPDFVKSHEQTPNPKIRLQLAREDLVVKKEFRSNGYATGPDLLQALS